MSAVLQEKSSSAAPKGLEISQDLTAASGPAASMGDVTVQRHVTKGASLRSGGSVTVGGWVESALIACCGKLSVPNGAIRGGRVVALQGIDCQAAGDSRQTPTELMVGFDERFMDFAEARIGEIVKAFEKVQQFRSTLEPMLKEHKTLTSDQKEQISDLLCRAGEAKKRAVAATQQLKKRMTEAESSARYECVVSEMIFAGVAISFPGARIVFQTAMSGPVKLVGTPGDKGVAVHATQIKTGKSQMMPPVAHIDRMSTLRTSIAKLEQS